MSAADTSGGFSNLPLVNHDSFAEQTIFLTGCTGFLGKVILEKLMRSFSCKRIYVLLRPKKNKDVSTRFIAGILGSRIFDQLRAARGSSFEAWATSLVFPIAGDLLLPGIGISESDRERLTSEVSVIIHSAASVDFDLPLEEATQINVDGSMEILQLAKQCRHLKSHVHVSTCYVNCNQRGFVREEVYPCPFDPEQMYREIKASSPAVLAKKKEAIIRDWPNTYTFTKFLTEHLLLRSRGDVPLVICRPSIIAASLSEPVPGWTDSISAATAVFLAAGMGICRTLPGSMWNVADVVPVDLCASMILLAAASAVAVNGAVQKLTTVPSGVPVVHCGTSSSKDPMMWFQASMILADYFNRHPPPNQVMSSQCILVEDEAVYARRRFWESTLPLSILSLIDKVTMKTIKPVRNLNKAFKIGHRVNSVFAFFTANEWVFDAEFVRRRSRESDAVLAIDQLDSVDWYQYVLLVCYGMRKFCLGQPHAEPPLLGTVSGDVLQRSLDQRISIQHPSPLSRGRDSDWVRKRVPMDYAAPCHDAISERVLGRVGTDRSRRKVKEHLDRIGTRFSHGSVRLFGYTLQKLFTSMFERISVNKEQIGEISKLVASAQVTGPVLLIPTHRSYLDFLMLSYVLFAYHVKVPLIAAGEDFERIPGVNTLLRQAGAFYMRRKISRSHDPLYYDTFKAYFQEALMEHGLLEFFVEGTRSRSGETLSAKHGLLTFAYELIASAQIPDLQIVPVSMTYERVMEAETYPGELLGEPKVKETLGRIMKGVSVLGSQYGRANIVFGSPISVKEWMTAEESPTVGKLGNLITSKLDEGLVIMSTHIVATALLQSARTGSVRETDLVAQVEWIRDILVSHKRRCEISQTGSLLESVRRCIDYHFKDFVTRRGDELSLNGKNRHSVLMLAYYRNQLLSTFRDEAIVTIAMLTSGKAFTGVSSESLIRLVSFIAPLLGRSVDIESVTERMMKNCSILWNNESFKLERGNGEYIHFLTSLVFPSIDSVWLTLAALEQKNAQPVSTIQQAHKFALCMYRDGAVKFQGSCTTDAIKHTLHALVKLGVIDKAGTVLIEKLDELKNKVARYRFESHISLDEMARYSEGSTVFDNSKTPTVARL